MIEIQMPRLSDTMTEGTIATWHKQVGDPVVAGEILVEIETDKAVMEFEAYESGTLSQIRVAEGDQAVIGSVIALVDDGTPGTGDQVSATAATVLAPGPPVPSLPAEPTTAAAAPTRLLASPVVRRLAREHGLDLASVPGSGPGGRIVRADVEPLLTHSAPAAPVTQPLPPVPDPTGTLEAAPGREADGPMDPRGSERVRLTSVRRLIADRLTAAARDIPHIQLTAGADAEELVGLRRTVNEHRTAQGRATLSVNDLLVRACALALREHPDINASYVGAAGPGDAPQMLRHSRINIGIALASEHGLLVPVVHDVDQKALGHISSQIREFAALATTRKLRADQMAGGTFTVSNLGMFGVETFNALINPPEGAILAVGALVRRPTVVGAEIVVRHRLNYTLSADHRIIDGAAGAAFLATLTSLVEHPWNLLA
ncbi:2-oxo acid dehydrogenase subunit E2 [Nakamurella silvestris]|nr:2-oxo acid dehydrogenase subunit E2 [Nakamurella silvestris]